MKRVLAFLFVFGFIVAPTAYAGPHDTTHTISNMDQDALGGAQSTKSRFEGVHAGTSTDPYIFLMVIQKVSGSGQGPNLVFREIDAENFNQLDFRANEVVIKQKVSGSMTTKARGCRGFGSAGQDYAGVLYLKGNRFEFFEMGASAPCVAWTDPSNRFATGQNASYYCMPGTRCLWKQVEARPLGFVASPLAWNFPNVQTGYLHQQPYHPSSQSIMTSRPVYTWQEYAFGSANLNAGSNSAADFIEHGSDGNVEYHVDRWTGNVKLIYRARTGQYGYHLELTSGTGKIRRKNSSGTYTQLGPTVSVPTGRHVMVKVDGSRHRLIDEVTGATLIDVTDATYNGRDPYTKTYLVGPGEHLQGSFVPRP